MRTGHLFAGGGGGIYADLILGHTPIFAVEWDPYACAVLRSRAADGWFPGLRVHEGDVQLFNPSEYAGSVDCIHAGFPCQDISPAGRGAGIHGKRSGLYREVLRVADIIRPRYLFLENSASIVSKGLGVVIGDLASRGYNAKWTILAGSEVGAPHERKRWWCIAENPDTTEIGWQRTGDGGAGKSNELEGLGAGDVRTWTNESRPFGVAYGVAYSVNRAGIVGNGQIPLCAAAAWKILGGPCVAD